MSERFLKWIMSQFARLLAFQKEYLPKKSKRNDYPSVLWIEPPEHIHFKDNRLRGHFSEALARASSYYEGNYSLPLKKAWTFDDPLLFNKEDRRFTARGYATYWEAVNKAVRYADTLMLKKEALKKEKVQKAKQV